MNILSLLALIALIENLDSSLVSCPANSEHLPVAVSLLDRTRLQSGEATRSLPQNLSSSTSVVSVSECGTGVGYTSFSVRGISGYHTNVTLNGINLGDSESQEVFWVNIPGLSEILSTVELQRGLGTASCGPGAFGASLALKAGSPEKRGLRGGGGLGSYGTGSAFLRCSSGTLKNGLFADGAVNLQRTDGYILNAPARAGSAFVNAGWKGTADIVHAVFLQGWQRSAITWNGVPFEIYPLDRTFNVSEGDTDNFRQAHVQLNWRHGVASPSQFEATLNYTRGDGWYDIDGGRDLLGNDLFALRSEYLTHPLENLKISATAYLSHFSGDHSGVAPDGALTYSDTARKREADLSLRAEWEAGGGLTAFGEVQYRGVIYDLHSHRHVWNFCNPRLGVNWSPESAWKIYAFAAIGHREPSRADFEADAGVKPERLYDFELGYKYSSGNLAWDLNLYAMEYRDMLLETGNVDSQGFAIKSNVGKAHRRGIEASLAAKPLNWLRLDLNGTLSDNRYDDGTLLLSPSVIAYAGAEVSPWRELTAKWEFKHVGRQFYNNTGVSVDGERSSEIPSYTVCNLSARYRFSLRRGTPGAGLTVAAYLNNVLNLKYFAYAYNYGVFPAAPMNGSVKLTLEL